MRPPKSILDRTFRYTNAADTDIRRLFNRVRYEQQLAQRRTAEQASAAAEPNNVQPLRRLP